MDPLEPVLVFKTALGTILGTKDLARYTAEAMALSPKHVEALLVQRNRQYLVLAT